MIEFVGTLLFVILLLTLVFVINNTRKEHRELQYLTKMLHEIRLGEREGSILIPSDQKYLNEHLKEVNHFLDVYYEQKRSYDRKARDLSKVLTNLSHDIRTPITILKGNSEILLKQIKEGEENTVIYKTASKVNYKADELTTNINDYFLLSKVFSGDLIVEISNINIVKLCNDTLLAYYDQLTQMNFQVSVPKEMKPIWIHTDPVILGRILKNIMDNAIIHGRDGKFLGISTCEDKDTVSIRIEDHGRGIPKEHIDHIFERNYTTAARTTGNGLGLAIVAQLAARLGMQIEVQSIPYEKTIFTIIINR
ncbi:MAG: HAMP domain-containing sensor histidine kinase [Absicoccus sp.]|uniref:sensor histidine kinase n=1 Tax=Absicoccus TaxID=2718525 RepID=UPI0024090915|nr:MULTISPECIES: HAMP domain-containing sensor histidine kinase [Absicoccus]MDD6459412.1 HAMP domain-containing sensor histidine kinase [Absicoccus porci]MDY3035561.1 HAMP domain-containing sensor histidine kinase [Absicoccus sp.]